MAVERMAAEPRTVLILGARAPAALDHARRFAAHGWRVVVGDSIACRISAWSRAVHAHVALPSARDRTQDYARALCEAIARHRVQLVVPTCEETFYLSHVRALLPADVRVCTADFATLRALHSKWTFLQLAAEAGADVPESALVDDIHQARAWSGTRAVVLKPEYSRFGVHVRLYPDGLQADAAPFAQPGRWVAQALCRGRELCSYAIADAGRLLAHVCYRPLHRIGGSSSYCFEACEVPAIRAFAHKLVAQLGYTGQISFDWIQDAGGRCWVLECNPRAISGVHLFAPADDLPGALMGTVNVCVEPSSTTPRMIAAVMASAGLASSIRSLEAAHWWRDWQRARDVIGVAGDARPLAGALLDLGSHARLALRGRCSLRQAATRDCEWDGDPIAGAAA